MEGPSITSDSPSSQVTAKSVAPWPCKSDVEESILNWFGIKGYFLPNGIIKRVRSRDSYGLLTRHKLNDGML